MLIGGPFGGHHLNAGLCLPTCLRVLPIAPCSSSSSSSCFMCSSSSKLNICGHSSTSAVACVNHHGCAQVQACETTASIVTPKRVLRVDSRLFLGPPNAHWLSGWPKNSSNFTFTTKIVFPKSLKFMNSGSENGLTSTSRLQTSPAPAAGASSFKSAAAPAEKGSQSWASGHGPCGAGGWVRFAYNPKVDFTFGFREVISGQFGPQRIGGGPIRQNSKLKC